MLTTPNPADWGRQEPIFHHYGPLHCVICRKGAENHKLGSIYFCSISYIDSACLICRGRDNRVVALGLESRRYPVGDVKLARNDYMTVALLAYYRFLTADCSLVIVDRSIRLLNMRRAESILKTFKIYRPDYLVFQAFSP